MTFIGTFGVSTPLGKYYQPITADTHERACRYMADTHGLEYSTVYTVDDYKRSQDEGFFKGHRPLGMIGEGLR